MLVKLIPVSKGNLWSMVRRAVLPCLRQTIAHNLCRMIYRLWACQTVHLFDTLEITHLLPIFYEHTSLPFWRRYLKCLFWKDFFFYLYCNCVSPLVSNWQPVHTVSPDRWRRVGDKPLPVHWRVLIHWHPHLSSYFKFSNNWYHCLSDLREVFK